MPETGAVSGIFLTKGVDLGVTPKFRLERKTPKRGKFEKERQV